MSGPFIITENGYWIVDFWNRLIGGILSEKSGLTTLPRSGWKYWDDDDGERRWVLDDTLLFLPGGPGKEL